MAHEPPTDRFAVARAAMMRASANRAVDDPKALARAARIVRAGIERGVLSPEDVLPEAVAS